MLRVATPLSPETENLISRVIGCAIAIHRELGPGYGESVYARALTIEFDREQIPYEHESVLQVAYRNQIVGLYRLDFVVARQVVLEIKCVDRLVPVHQAQVIGYLRACKLRVGLLLNFKVAILPDGLRRIVL